MKKYLFPVICCLFAVLFISCSEQEKKYIAKKIFAGTDAETLCPFLTTCNKGNIVLSWIKKTNDSTTILCYAESNDKGKTFGNTIEVVPSKKVYPNAENLPKIIFKPDGEIIAVWGTSNPNPKNNYSGKVFYSQSFDEGKTWNTAIPLVTDSASCDQRYFDMTILPDGEAGIIWLDNRSKTNKEGMTLYFAKTNGKNGFEHEKPIGETCCQCCRTDFFTDSKGNIHAVYRDIINDSIRDMVHIVSIDGGKTFFQPKRISADNWIINGCPHTGPTMAENKNGLHFAWFTAGGQEGVYYCNSIDNGKTFSPRQMLSSHARHPQITTLSNETIGIVWEETINKDSVFYSKIVLHLSKPDGQQTRQDVIFGNVNAGYPVIISNDDKTVLVAWTQQMDNLKKVSGEIKQHQHAKIGQVFYKMMQME